VPPGSGRNPAVGRSGHRSAQPDVVGGAHFETHVTPRLRLRVAHAVTGLAFEGGLLMSCCSMESWPMAIDVTGRCRWPVDQAQGPEYCSGWLMKMKLDVVGVSGGCTARCRAGIGMAGDLVSHPRDP